MTFNVVAGLLALFVLKPMRAKHFAKSREIVPGGGRCGGGTAPELTGAMTNMLRRDRVHAAPPLGFTLERHMATVNPASNQPKTTTADDTLQRKSRDAGVISGGHLVAKALKNEGVDTIFTLCGGHIIDIYDGCVDEGIRIIDVRHEQVAAHAADGYARQTGKLGCVGDHRGPGLHQRDDRHRHRVPLREPGPAHRRPGRARRSTRWARCRTCRTSTSMHADHQVRRDACRAPNASRT